MWKGSNVKTHVCPQGTVSARPFLYLSSQRTHHVFPLSCSKTETPKLLGAGPEPTCASATPGTVPRANIMLGAHENVLISFKIRILNINRILKIKINIIIIFIQTPSLNIVCSIFFFTGEGTHQGKMPWVHHRPNAAWEGICPSPERASFWQRNKTNLNFSSRGSKN